MRRILIADDDKAMLKLYTRLFTAEKIAFEAAGSVAEALELIAGENFDLLITDFEFGDGLGTEIIGSFKKKRPGGKSLIVTGSAPNDERLLKSGADEFFAKPFECGEFMETVKQALAA